MIRKLIIFIFIFCLSSPETPADTNTHILGEIVLKKNKRLYIDKGRNDNVEVGQKFEVLYDGQKIGGGIITWIGEDISYSRIDSASFSRYSYIDPLEVKVFLEKPLKYEGGVLHLPFYRKLNLKPKEIITPDDKAAACLLYDGLVRFDNKGQIVAGLAHSWEIHGNTYTFYLNPEVKFHSGKPLNALDVAYSLLQLAKAPIVTPASSFILEVDGYDEVHYGKKNELRGIFIPNTNTIAITTKDVFTPFLKYLAGPGGYIIPNIEGSQTLPMPIGTGPFQAVSAAENRITLAANNSYFETPPVLDSIIFYRYNNRQEAALDFELGRLDLIYFDSREDRDLLTSGDYATRKYYTSAMVILGFNCRHEYQREYRFSKALQYLFDKESIVRVLLGGSARTANGLIPPTLDLESENTNAYYFSPSESKTMIAQIKNLPKQLNLVYDNIDPVLESIAGYIAGQLRQTGIKISVKKADSKDLEQSVDLSAMDMYLFRYDLPVPDPDAFFYPLFARQLSGQTNYFYYDNPQLERFIEGARLIDDAFTRNDIYFEAERLIIEQPPLIALYNPIMTVAFRRDLAGFEPDYGAYINLRKAYFQAGK